MSERPLSSARPAAPAPVPPVPPPGRDHRRPGAGWSLERKLPLLIAALLAAVIGAFGAATYREVRLAAVERATARLVGVAQQLATMSGTSSAARLAPLRALAGDSTVTAALAAAMARVSADPVPDAGATAVTVDAPVDARAAGRLRARMMAVRQPGDSTAVAWELWTADGRRRARLGAAATARDSAVLAATIAAAARTDSVQRSPFYQVAQRVAVWTVVPVRAGGRTAGFLAERRHLAAAPRTEQMIRELTGEDVAVLVTSRVAGRNAGEWATVGGAPRAAPFALRPGDLAAGAGAGGARVQRVRDAQGAWHYAAAAAVPQTPWLIVLAEPEAAVLRRPREFLRTLLGVGALVLAVGAFGAWLVGRHVTRPLVAVTRAAEALATGDYGQRVAVAGGAELARLAATFNVMAAGVGEAHATLAERNAGLQRANAAKVQFLAMMSHELRTPLNAIGGYTELMALGLRGPVTPEQLDDLARIRRSKDHLLSIITDLLSFARADAGHLTFALGPVAVGDVLADVEALVGQPFAAKGVQLRVEPAPAGAVARADREKLQQVVLNLLTNALRFTPPGGAVTLTCTLGTEAPGDAAPGDAARAGTVSLVVRDTGVGIPPDRLDAIFEPFVQVDAGLTRQVGGTGLGLAIVRTLVGAMGGHVAVESAVGAGSTFTVTLPGADAPDAPAVAGLPRAATEVVALRPGGPGAVGHDPA